MDKEEVAKNRRKWLKALRSGEYKQTRGMLRSEKDGDFCCLGVACDISGLGAWEGQTYVAFEGFYVGTLKGRMAEWLGLREVVALQSYLINLNDNADAPFEKIANYAENVFNNLPHFGDPT